MSSITFTNLKTAVRERADMVSSDFVSDAELGRIINGEAAELHALIVSRYEDDFTTSYDFTLSTGTSSLVLSLAVPTFYKLRALQVLQDGTYVPLERFDFQDISRAGGSYSSYRDPPVQYRLVGSILHFTPTDRAAGSYRLWYVQGYQDLSSGSDALSYPENWHEMVIAGSAAKCLLKEESDASGQLRIKEQLRQRILAQSTSRDAGASSTIARVRRRDRRP